MGRYLAEAGGVPGLVVTSSAVRARETVRLASEAGGWKCAVEIAEDLYEATPDAITSLVQRQPGAHDKLLLAGHEPGFSETVSRLIGGGEVRMPTAAIACLEFDVELWAEVKMGGGRLVWLLTPKILAEE
jgi:phosphohistidine phosphatase